MQAKIDNPKSAGLGLAWQFGEIKALLLHILGKGAHVHSLFQGLLALLDPFGEPSGAVRTGTITLAEDILGIIINDAPLDNTDAILGAPGTLYPVGENVRGIELDNVDTLIMLADLRTVSMTLKVSASIDQMRILTVPEPGMLTLLGAGGLCLLRRVRRSPRNDRP